VIVLLDEPALTLHARAQADFLHFINDRLAAERQVIYTTHSPFMVQADHLESVRIVEDQGPDVGAIVSTDVGRVAPDSAFPLQGALGYDLAQHLFVGPHNLVVEGMSDFTYLTVLSELLRSKDRVALDERWRILPVGGMQNIPTFVALLGRNLDVTVVIDASNKGMQRLNNMATEGLLDSQRIVSIAEFVKAKQADIEDLFEIDDYLGIYDAAFNTTTDKSKLPPGDRVVKRLADAAGFEDFDHGPPADYLLHNRDTVLPGLSATTLDRFEQLFDRINATIVASSS
jgi:predicted ATP-dependent endonuclease of OLD family